MQRKEGEPAPKFCWKCTLEIVWSQIDKPVKNEVAKDVLKKKLVCPTCKTEYPLDRLDRFFEKERSKLDLLEGGPIFYQVVKPKE